MTPWADEEKFVQQIKSMEGKIEMRKKVIQGLAGGSVVIALLCILPLPTRINKTVQAVEWSLHDSSIACKQEIKVDGWYFRYLFRNNTFSGMIVLPGAVESFVDNDEQVIKMEKLTFDDSPGGAVLSYRSSPNYPPFHSIGEVFVDGNFSDVFIALKADGEVGDRFISLYANDREDGLNQLRRFAEKDEVVAQWLNAA